MSRARQRGPLEPSSDVRAPLTGAIGRAVVQFQEDSAQFDRVAAQVMALERDDLPCLTAILFGGLASIDQLAARVQTPAASVLATVTRLCQAGYTRRHGRGPRATIDITEHAREWIERVWSPLRVDGERLMARYRRQDLATIHAFMDGAGSIQQKHIRRLQASLAVPTPATPHQLTGGLAPAALRRVEVYVEAHLASTLRLKDLAARAGLSPAHFARAFKVTTGMTPRVFLEQRRVARAEQLIDVGLPLVFAAMEAGFGSQSQLSVAFRRRRGMPPGRYRRERTRA